MNRFQVLSISSTKLFLIGVSCLFLYCYSGTVTNLILISKLGIVSEQYYIIEKMTWMTISLSLFITWGVFSCIFYLAALSLGGNHCPKKYFSFSMISLFTGVLFFLLQIYIIKSTNGDTSPISNSTTIQHTLKYIGISSYIVFSLLNIIIVKISMKLSWLRSSYSTTLPIIVIVILSRLFSLF